MNRWLAAVLVMLLLCPAANAAVALNTGSSAALVAADGSILTDKTQYTAIKPLTAGLFCASLSEGGCVILKADGTRYSDAVYESVTCTGDTLLYSENGLYGVLSDQGDMLTPAEYGAICENGEGDLIGLRGTISIDSARPLDYIERSGTVTAIGLRVLGTLIGYSNGYMPVRLGRTGRYGYIDSEGIIAFGGEFTAAQPFISGYAVFSTDEGTGMIDTTGNQCVKPEYDEIRYSGGCALLQRGNEVTVVQKGGTIKGTYTGSAGTDMVFTDTAIYVLDAEGEACFSAPADATVSACPDGRYIVSDGMWGTDRSRVYDAEGNPLSGTYKSLIDLGSGTYAAAHFDATAVTDAGGTVLYYRWDPQSIRWAVISADGTELTEYAYTSVTPAGDGTIILSDGTGFSLFTANGIQAVSGLT